MRTVNLWQYPVFAGTKNELMTEIAALKKRRGFHIVVTLNPQILAGCESDPVLETYLQGAAMLVADGVGVTLATRFSSGFAVPRYPGVELVRELFEAGGRFYLLGAAPDVLQRLEAQLKDRYPKVVVVGRHHGYFAVDSDERVVTNVAQVKPEFVLVAMGFPRQEKLLMQLQRRLDVGVGIGIGGSFDVLSGSKKRAPIPFQKMGLEWLYRIASEPKRILRLGYMPRFLLRIVKELFKHDRH